MSIPRDVLGLSALFAASGVVHLAKPGVYRPLMPAWVPRHDDVILASGVAELVLAVGLLHPRTRPVAGWSSAALLVAVFPGNVTMAVDASRTDNTAMKVAAFGRLPLQVPLIRVALRAAVNR